jgi:hypothetical protein
MQAAMRRLRLARHSEVVMLRTPIVALALLATSLSPVASAQARPSTTAPLFILDVHVTITDTRIVLDHHAATRGSEARFIIRNAGTKVHNFTLHGRTLAGGVREGFSRTLKPRQKAVVLIFLETRARIPYFDGLPADRGKAAMTGFFTIT